MKSIITFLLSVLAPLIIIVLVVRDAKEDEGLMDELKEKYAIERDKIVDHSKHEALQKEFTNAHEITQACLSCHNLRGDELMHSAHFLWERKAFIPGRGVTYPGKKNIRHLRKAPLKILISENESTALNAWMMLTSLGIENMKVMGGGKQNLIQSMDQGELDASILFFKDEKARFNYPALMKVSSGPSPQEGAEGQEKEKTEVIKVQGGC
ncbi:MAG: hypothetical protein GX587_11010 [Bacteroidales bacterium]|nr:hypothetical protein [Bacteroidales bacterium]